MPTNIAKDILAVVSDQQIYVAKAFLAASSARAQEQSRQDRLDAEAAAAAPNGMNDSRPQKETKRSHVDRSI